MSSSTSSGSSPKQLIVLVPIYQKALSPLEQFGLSHSLRQLKPGRTVAFMGPQSLDISGYQAAFPGIPFVGFPDHCFASIPGYNRVLMSEVLYEHFSPWEFMLILQTDALLLRDELDQWTASVYDYVGAPWPDGLEIDMGLDRFSGSTPIRLRAKVGNGGLSLRRNKACLKLLREFPQALQYFIRTGSSEDLFFSFMGSVSRHFLIPNEVVASEFSLELNPRELSQRMGGVKPMGGHAIWKYDPKFWLEQMGAEDTIMARTFLDQLYSH